MNLPQQTSRRFALLLLVCLAVSLFSVIYPIYVIRPFRPQGARELAAALVVARFRPWVALISAAAAIVACWPGIGVGCREGGGECWRRLGLGSSPCWRCWPA